MYRRQLLGAVGATGTLLVAGCAELGLRSGRDEPAELEASPSAPAELEASLSAPAELRLGEAFHVTVAVTNIGDQPGTYRGRLRAFTGMVHGVEHDVEVGPVPPDRTHETTVGPIVAPYAGGWTVDLDDGASHAIDVFPVTVDAGESVEVVDGHRLTVDSVEVRDAYDYRTSTGETGTRTPPPGRRLLFATVRVENVGIAPRATPSRSEFSGVSSDGRAPVFYSPETWDEYLRPGTPYPGKRRIAPGDSLSGWLSLLVPAPAEGVVAVIWNRDLDTSPPEALWRARPTNTSPPVAEPGRTPRE